MDPAFWNNLPAILAAINVILVTMIGYFARQTVQNIHKEVQANTQVTVAGNRTICEKVDSAHKEVQDTVVQTADTVKKEAVQTAKAAAVISQQAAKTAREEVRQQLAPIAEKLNGGPGGLADLTVRITALEAKYEILVQGQMDMTRSLNHLSDVLERKVG